MKKGKMNFNHSKLVYLVFIAVLISVVLFAKNILFLKNTETEPLEKQDTQIESMEKQDIKDILLYRIEDDKIVIIGCKEHASGDVVIPSTIDGYTVDTISYGAFYACTKITSLTIPSTVKTIKERISLESRGLKTIYVDPNNPNYISINGVLFDKDITTLIAYPQAKTENKYQIPKTVKDIGNYAFACCENLTEITIPNNITRIGEAAFAYCTGITSMNIPSKTNDIDTTAFAHCDNLKGVNIDKNNETYSSIDGNIFTNKGTVLYAYTLGNHIDSYKIPNGTKEIGEEAFLGDLFIKEVIIPKGVVKIGEGAFCCCENLTDITIPNTVKSIGQGVFECCENLINITIPNSVRECKAHMFSGCKKLKNVVLSNNVDNIEKSMFLGCTSLITISIPENVKKIDSSAFANCISLTNITIPSSVKKIEKDAFDRCINLQNVVFSYGVEEIGEGSFEHCYKLLKVTIPKSIKKIEEKAFGFDYNDRIEGFTMYGTKGTVAEKYAKQNGITFIEEIKTN